jgi:hypothetical protein
VYLHRVDHSNLAFFIFSKDSPEVESKSHLTDGRRGTGLTSRRRFQDHNTDDRNQRRSVSMVIVLDCPGCGKRYEVDGSLAGKKSRCKQCGAVFPIPAPSARVVEPARSPPPVPAPAAPPPSQWEAIVDGGAREPRTRRAAAPSSPPGAQPSAQTAGAIVISCPECRRKYEFDSLLAGKKAKCKDCGAVFPIPVPRGGSSATAPAQKPGEPPPTAFWEAALEDVSCPSAAGARPVSADEDEYFQSPPRASYPKQTRKTSSRRATDPSIGITAAGWYFSLSVLLLIVMTIWFAVSTSQTARVRGIFGLCMIGIEVLGTAVVLWGGIWMLVIAFRETTGQGLLVLLVPCYSLYYTFSRWEETKGAFALQMAYVGSVILFSLIGVGVVGVSERPGTDRGPVTTMRQDQAPAPAAPGARTLPGVVPSGRGGLRRPPGRFGSVPMDPKSQYRQLVAQHGDKTIKVIYVGIPANSDPAHGVTMRDVTEAANKKMRELAPGATNWLALSIDNDSGLVLAPVEDIRALAAKIDFGKTIVDGNTIFVDLSREYIASVPRLPAEPKAVVASAKERASEPVIPADADAVTKSLMQLKSADVGRIKEGVQRLGRTTPNNQLEEVVGALVPLLAHDDGFLVNDVVKTLAVWRSPSAVPALIERTSDNRFFVRKEAIKTLAKYKDARASEPIAERLKEDGFEAEDALKQMGSIAEPAVIERLTNPDPEIRRRACNILQEIGGHVTLQAMQAMPPDSEFSVRVAAQNAIKHINARAGPLPGSGRSGRRSAVTRPPLERKP